AIEVVLAVTLGAAGLREPVVHADAAARADPLHVAVEHFSADFAAIVFVEAELSEVVEHTSRLRGYFGIYSGDVVGQRVGRPVVIVRLVTQPGNPVANGRKAKAGDGRILGRVCELIDVVGDKPSGYVNGCSVRVIAPIRSGNDYRRVVQVNAMSQDRCGFVRRVGRGIT